MKFHHIGVATYDIEKTLNKLKKHLNIISISDITYDEKQNAKLCMIELEDKTKIELISGKIVETILKKKQYLYHTCYIVNDINLAIERLIDDGAYLIRNPINAKLFNERKVAFLMWDIGIVELLEGGE